MDRELVRTLANRIILTISYLKRDPQSEGRPSADVDPKPPEGSPEEFSFLRLILAESPLQGVVPAGG